MSAGRLRPYTKHLLKTMPAEIDKIRQSLIPEGFHEKVAALNSVASDGNGDHTACPRCTQTGVSPVQLDAGNDSQ